MSVLKEIFSSFLFPNYCWKCWCIHMAEYFSISLKQTGFWTSSKLTSFLALAMHTEISFTNISIAVILPSNETSKTHMAKTVVVLSWWFVLLFIGRDIPSRNVVFHMCFPTKSVSHCSVPPSHAICCAVSNVWRIWETRPWPCARSVRLWDMAMQNGKWLGDLTPPT